MNLPLPHFPSLPQLPGPPTGLVRWVATLPSQPPSWLLAQAVNRLAWRTLGELDWSVAVGRHFAIQVSDLGLRLDLTVTPNGFRAVPAGTAEVTFAACAADLARLALRLEDPDTLFFNRRLRIEGDTNLGLAVKNLLDSIDLERLLANMPGGIGHLVRIARDDLLARQNVAHRAR